MKNFICFLFLILSNFSVQTYSQRNQLLYSVTHPKDKKTSYLFGTMHVMSQEKFFFPKKIEKLITKCDVLCMEVANISNQSIEPNLLFDMDKSIKEFCTESQWDSILKWAETDLMMNEVNFETNFKHAKPFVLIQLMLQNTLPKEQMSHEKELETIAEKLKMREVGLETINEQLNIFSKIDYTSQVDLIMKQLSELDESKDDFKRMEDIYTNQDLDALCSLTEEDFTPVVKENLLTKRNLSWISKMKKHMENQGVFFAVGAGHLCGEDGLIELLLKEGYIVEGIRL